MPYRLQHAMDMLPRCSAVLVYTQQEVPQASMAFCHGPPEEDIAVGLLRRLRYVALPRHY